MDGTEAHINFDAPAVLRKWPSLANQRTEDATPYLLVDGTVKMRAGRRIRRRPSLRDDSQTHHRGGQIWGTRS
jgi:hypothetical protein